MRSPKKRRLDIIKILANAIKTKHHDIFDQTIGKCVNIDLDIKGGTLLHYTCEKENLLIMGHVQTRGLVSEVPLL